MGNATSIQLPSAQEIARALGGHVRQDGCVAFPGPGRTPRDRSCTLKLDPNAPGGYVVSDARDELPFTELRDYVCEKTGLKQRRSRGNGAAGRPGPTDLPPCSDEAIALRFAERHADKLRYVAKWGAWMHFDGRKWAEDATLLAFNFARHLCREAAEHAKKPSDRKDTASARKRAAVISLAREDRKHAATVDQWDANPDALNTPAGVIDLSTFECRPHEPADYMTRITAAAPDGVCPQWRRFLEEITDGSKPLQDFLQRIAGYALTGDTREHAFFFLYGTGANGKSVFIDTLAGILGDYHCTAPIETFTASLGERHPTELAMLRGARLVTAIETEEGRRWAESRIKTLTGGDRIKARFMKQDFFEYRPQFKLIIAGNHKPRLRTVDEAIRRRFHLVPFTVTIPPERRNLDLRESLKAEWPGILQWALDGCAAWREYGLAPPEIVTAATAEYLAGEDTFTQWLEERCERVEGAFAETGELYGNFKESAERAGENALSMKWFAGAMQQHGYELTRHARSRRKGFLGIRLYSA